MPFSLLRDPVDVARSQAALDAAWEVLKSGVSENEREREWTRLSEIIASSALAAIDEADLVKRALEKFRKAAALSPISGD